MLYGTFLLWMLSELYEMLPEAGDLEKPKLAFFFDEAHLLFNDAPKALIEKVEQVVRLIRSKGVSVWFITQVPSDLPDTVLGQIGNKVQHALRAYTPRDQKALRAAAQAFRANEAFDTETVLQELGTGEALVSVLNEKGIPSIVQKAGILPPRSSMNAVEAFMIQDNIDRNPLKSKYAQAVDQESAYEVLTEEAQQAQKEAEEAARLAAEEAQRQQEEKEREKEEKAKAKERAARQKNNPLNKVVSSAASAVGREIGRKLVRGILGSLKW